MHVLTHSSVQCDQIGLFLKGFGKKIHAKVAQIFGHFLGFVVNITFN